MININPSAFLPFRADKPLAPEAKSEDHGKGILVLTRRGDLKIHLRGPAWAWFFLLSFMFTVVAPTVSHLRAHDSVSWQVSLCRSTLGDRATVRFIEKTQKAPHQHDVDCPLCLPGASHTALDEALPELPQLAIQADAPVLVAASITGHYQSNPPWHSPPSHAPPILT